MEKKVARLFEAIRRVRGLSVEEKYLFARSLAATSDERWRLHENFLRSHGLYTRSERRRFGFFYEMHGLRSFQYDYQRAKRVRWLQTAVAVLPLERIYASKRFVGRPKDVAHLPLLQQSMRMKRLLRPRRGLRRACGGRQR
jgi:hypothetical protein